MKREGFLFEKIANIDNLDLAGSNASRNKNSRICVIKYNKEKEKKNKELQQVLLSGNYKTSKYTTFTIHEPKERIIYRLPFYPDRIVHHAIMNIMEPIFIKNFIEHTYSCIKGRGIHKINKDLSKVLKNHPKETKYCLILDVTKFYPSIDREILLKLVKTIIKDNKLLEMFNEIIYSVDNGVPIGNYLSQFLANFYMSKFDHWVKEELKAKYYFCYSDDRRIFSDNKQYLRNVCVAIKLYLKHVLNLKIKNNYSIIDVDKEGVYFVGYKFYRDHIEIGKRIKKSIFRTIHLYKSGKLNKSRFKQRMNAYSGWLKYCNSKNLLRKIELLTGLHYSNFVGKVVNISNFFGKSIYIVDARMKGKTLRIDFIYNHKPYTTYSNSSYLINSISRLKTPILFKIVNYSNLFNLKLK